jgi:hypothetical protein
VGAQSYEIRCPICHSVVPADATGCPTCATAGAAAVPAARTTNGAAPAPPAPAPAGISPSLRLKDYHRLVRANYGAVEGHPQSRGFGNPLVPAALLVLIALLVSAAFAFHWL